MNVQEHNTGVLTVQALRVPPRPVPLRPGISQKSLARAVGDRVADTVQGRFNSSV